jgi:hypothetical protein
MTDFYTLDGGRLSEHPADLWTQAITRAGEIREELAAQKSLIERLAETSRQEPGRMLDAATQRYLGLATPRAVGEMGDCLERLRGSVAQARRVAAAAPGLLRTARQPTDLARTATRGAIETLSEPLASRRTLDGRIFRALAATLLIMLLALAYASVTIWSAAYDSNPLFHAFGDYLTMFSAAFGSGAAAMVLALAGNWQVTGGEAVE